MTGLTLHLEVCVSPTRDPRRVDLAPGECLLIGREPDPSTLPAGLAPPDAHMRVMRVESDGGPNNHLWVHHSKERLTLCDLRSYGEASRGSGRDEASVVRGAAFIKSSPAFLEAYARVIEAAGRGVQTVLLGETGSGKSTLVRCFHLHSDRASGPFESVNCAEIDRQFARSRLFGARKGAYTDCLHDIAGAVECARGGTLFLDEVTELSHEVQGELLNFLDDQRYKRLGDDQWRQADVRLVCGTNADLRKAVRDGRFRSDLWYRIAGRIVEVPPLRRRPEDVVAALQARRVSARADALTVYDALSVEARHHVAHEYAWPGNFRELNAFAARLPVATQPGSIALKTCIDALREGAPDLGEPPPPAMTAPGTGAPWTDLTAVADRVAALRHGPSGPTRASELHKFVEEVVKPLFFARALGLEHLSSVPERPTPSYEELGRLVGCDATTVKHQLGRFIELRKELAR